MSKVVLITGSATGIGQQTSYLFAKAGWNVIITHFNDRKAGLETAKECECLGAASTIVLNLDITKESSIKAALNSVKKRYGKIDVLINNAGILIKKLFKDHTIKDIDGQISTNLGGLIKMTYFTLPLVKDTIINIASRRGMLVIPDACVYGATKWGVRGFTKDLAIEYPKLHIVAVNPTLTATKMTGHQGMEPEKVAKVVFDTAVKKIKVESGGDVNVWEVYGVKPI